MPTLLKRLGKEAGRRGGITRLVTTRATGKKTINGLRIYKDLRGRLVTSNGTRVYNINRNVYTTTPKSNITFSSHNGNNIYIMKGYIPTRNGRRAAVAYTRNGTMLLSYGNGWRKYNKAYNSIY